jgi:type 1 fimbria pilin
VKLFAAVTVALALAAPAAAATGYSFGRQGGNIIPFTVTISATGTVHVTGPVKVGRTKVTAKQLAPVRYAAQAVDFSARQVLCPHTLPDIAATFVAAGARKLTVHGGCDLHYTKLWNALTAAVKLTY